MLWIRNYISYFIIVYLNKVLNRSINITFYFNEGIGSINIIVVAHQLQITNRVRSIFFKRERYCFKPTYGSFFEKGFQELEKTKLCTCNGRNEWACKDCNDGWTCGCNGDTEIPCDHRCHWTRWQFSCGKKEDEAITAKPETGKPPLCRKKKRSVVQL